MHHRLTTPSPALVISIIALIVALGGTGYATSQLPGRASQAAMKKGKGKKVLRGPRGGRGPAGTQGIQGIQGIPGTQGTQGTMGLDGAKGERGPSEAFQGETDAGTSTATGGTGRASVDVPPGDYVAVGKAYVTGGGTTDEEARCILSSTKDLFQKSDESFTTVPHTGSNSGPPSGASTAGAAALGNMEIFHLPQGGTVSEDCAKAPSSAGADTISFRKIKVVVVQVGKVFGLL